MKLKQKAKKYRGKICKKCNKAGHETGNCAVNIQEILYQLDEDEKKYVTQVSIRRSSDKWQIDYQLNYDANLNAFSKKIYFDLGKNEFKFLLNNREWKTSEFYDIVSNQMGDYNNIIDVKPIHRMKTPKMPKKPLYSEYPKDKKHRVEFSVSLLELLESEPLRTILGT